MFDSGGTAILYGNLAPDGAVIKTSAADPRLLQHTGPAVVFKDYNDMDARINRDDLDVTADSVLVLQNAGPLGGPGMPEWGMLPHPEEAAGQGVRDMVRISDARMSGTAYGTCVLHVSPESWIGGPLALVEDGDPDLARCGKRAGWISLVSEDGDGSGAGRDGSSPRRDIERGYMALYARARHAGASGLRFRFSGSKAEMPEPEIH